MEYVLNKPFGLRNNKFEVVVLQQDPFCLAVREHKGGDRLLLKDSEILELLNDGVKFRILKEGSEIKRAEF